MFGEFVETNKFYLTSRRLHKIANVSFPFSFLSLGGGEFGFCLRASESLWILFKIVKCHPSFSAHPVQVILPGERFACSRDDQDSLTLGEINHSQRRCKLRLRSTSFSPSTGKITKPNVL